MSFLSSVFLGKSNAFQLEFLPLLTTFIFISIICTVIISITNPILINAVAIGASELVASAGLIFWWKKKKMLHSKDINHLEKLEVLTPLPKLSS